MKVHKVMYYVGAIISLLIGLGHFFVPWLFNWYSYIPSSYQNLMVSIDYVNLCFSFMLFCLSVLVLIWGKKVFTGNVEAITVFGFLTLVWVFRLFIAIVNPVPLEPVAAVAYGQFAGSVIVAVSLLIPLLKVIRTVKVK